MRITSYAKESQMKKIIYCITGIIIGIILGLLTAKLWDAEGKDIKESRDDFNYGLESQNLTVSQVGWQEYPSFRKVSFVLEGDFVINVPENCTCLISGLEDNSALKEAERKKLYFKDGDKVIAYDQVHYQLNNAYIQSEGMLKGNDAIHDAVSGYRLDVVWDDNKEALGYIPPLSDCFTEWSEEENYFADNNYEMYLDNFVLSKTCAADYSTDTNQSVEGIKLIKKDGNILNCIIDNTNGSGDWEYDAQVPAIELWYRGAWLELRSPFDSNLAVAICCKGESREISVPDDTMEKYSYFLPGIYRLVLRGTDGGYITTEPFVIEQ